MTRSNMGSQLSWESICLTSRGSQVRALQVPFTKYGEIAQLARELGSYPWCRGFESPSRYYNGILAQLGEHLPYKQRVIGSSPIGPIYICGEIAQLARACGSYPQCRGFESPSRYQVKRVGNADKYSVSDFFDFSKYQIICLLLFTSGFLTVIMVKPEFKMRRFSPLKTRVKKPKTKGTKADSVEKVTVAELLPSLENTVLNKN